MKHVVLRISSFFCFSLRRSAKVSMITPKMRFSTMMMTMKKNRRSYTTRAGKRDSCTARGTVRTDFSREGGSAHKPQEKSMWEPNDGSDIICQ